MAKAPIATVDEWSSPGTRLSYASEHESLAMLEYFVHLDADDPPPDLILASADIPDELDRERVDARKLAETGVRYLLRPNWHAMGMNSCSGRSASVAGSFCVLLQAKTTG